MNHCPCCTGNLLRQVRSSGIYWFCPHCGQEMPSSPIAKESQQTKRKLRNVMPSLRETLPTAILFEKTSNKNEAIIVP